MDDLAKVIAPHMLAMSEDYCEVPPEEVWTRPRYSFLADNIAMAANAVRAYLESDEVVERVARAICAERGLSPDCLHEHHEWEDWPADEKREHVDPFTGQQRVTLMHRGWRNRDRDARAALQAAGGKQDG